MDEQTADNQREAERPDVTGAEGAPAQPDQPQPDQPVPSQEPPPAEPTQEPAAPEPEPDAQPGNDPAEPAAAPDTTDEPDPDADPQQPEGPSAQGSSFSGVSTHPAPVQAAGEPPEPDQGQGAAGASEPVEARDPEGAAPEAEGESLGRPANIVDYTHPAGAVWPDEETGLPRQAGQDDPTIGVTPSELPGGPGAALAAQEEEGVREPEQQQTERADLGTE